MLFRSSIGKKIIMSVTGLIWIGYLVLHMYGNLKAFGGADAFNHYAEALRELGAPLLGHGHALTAARIIFLVSISLHIWAALTLKRMAMRARPQTYQTFKAVEANYAAVTMRWGGAVIALFLVYHLAHFTWGTPFLNIQFVRGDPYHNLVMGFRNPVHLILYLLALLVVGFHLYHGSWSFFQTMGWRTTRYDRLIRTGTALLAVLVPLGYATVPLSVLVGFIQ